MKPIEMTILQNWNFLHLPLHKEIEVLNDSDLKKKLGISWGISMGGTFSIDSSTGNKTAFRAKGGANPRFVFNPNGFNTFEKHPGVIILKGKKLLTTIRELTMTIQNESSKYDWKIKGLRRHIENVFKQLSILTHERIDFVVTKKGIKGVIVDGMHIAMMKLFWPANSFEHYEIEKEGTLRVTNTIDVIHTMKTAGLNDLVSLQFDGHNLQINTENAKTTLSVAEDSVMEPKTPDLSNMTTLVENVPVNWYKEAISGCARKSALAEFRIGACKGHEEYEKLIIEAKGLGAHEGVWKYETPITTITSKQMITGFPLSYLKTLAILLKVAKIKEFNISLGHMCPMVMDWELLDGAQMKMFLAPRMED